MAREAKKPGSPKGTPGKAAGPAKAKATKKAMKRPTGELPKRNSSLAKFIKGSASAKGFTKAEVRTAAGKYRDKEKAAGGFGGVGALDRSGAALGKSIKETRKMQKPKSLASKVGGAAGKVAKRAKTVAREARDIPTAVSTVVSGRDVPGRNSSRGGGKFAVKDLKTQIKEVGSAIKSGKKGTEAAQVRFGLGLKRGTVGAGNSDVNVSKKKKKRK
jgi:hypothetical protein